VLKAGSTHTRMRAHCGVNCPTSRQWKCYSDLQHCILHRGHDSTGWFNM